MNTNSKITKTIVWTIITVGAIIWGYALVNFEIEKVDWGLITLAFATIFLGSVFQLQLPRTKIYISLAEGAVFYAIVIYSPPIAIVLSALESLNASFAFRRKGISIKKETILFNVATASITTAFAAWAAWAVFPDEIAAHNFVNVSAFVGVLAIIALVQFLVSSVLVSLLASNKSGKSFWKV